MHGARCANTKDVCYGIESVCDDPMTIVCYALRSGFRVCFCAFSRANPSEVSGECVYAVACTYSSLYHVPWAR